MKNYPTRQFPSDKKIIINLLLTLTGIDDVNTKDGFL